VRLRIPNTEIAVLALLALLPAGAVQAQSFDCDKAATPVERLICSLHTLGALDSELALEVKKAVAVRPAEREHILVDARRWVGERDRRCAPPANASERQQEIAAICLGDTYRARIGTLRKLAAPTAAESIAICRTLAARFLGPAQSDPLASAARDPSASSALQTLAASQRHGVTLAPPIAEFDSNGAANLAAWAKRAPQPFVLAPGTLRALEQFANYRLQLDRLPQTNFYAASVIKGTAHCYFAVYFEVRDGRAVAAASPVGWRSGGDDDGCGASRDFGQIDGVPVAFEELDDYTPPMRSSLTVTPWENGRFGEACTATFEYAPRFDAHQTLQAWDLSCQGPACEVLRGLALKLVEETQANPAEARKARLAALTQEQRRDYEALRKQASATEQSDIVDPAGFLQEEPFYLPLVYEGRVYLAALGHFTIGWRVFSDWCVKLTSSENERTKETASFAIGMTKGRPTGFTLR